MRMQAAQGAHLPRAPRGSRAAARRERRQQQRRRRLPQRQRVPRRGQDLRARDLDPRLSAQTPARRLSLRRLPEAADDLPGRGARRGGSLANAIKLAAASGGSSSSPSLPSSPSAPSAPSPSAALDLRDLRALRAGGLEYGHVLRWVLHLFFSLFDVSRSAGKRWDGQKQKQKKTHLSSRPLFSFSLPLPPPPNPNQRRRRRRGGTGPPPREEGDAQRPQAGQHPHR